MTFRVGPAALWFVQRAAVSFRALAGSGCCKEPFLCGQRLVCDAM